MANINALNGIKSEKDIALDRKAEQIRLSESVNPIVESKVARIKEIGDMIKELEAEEKALKSECEDKFAENNITTFTNQYGVVSFRSASTTRTVDLNRMEKENPDMFNEVFGTYGKTTNRASGYTWKFAN